MNKFELLDYIKRNGGGTFHVTLLEPVNYSAGYFVSVVGCEFILPVEHVTAPTLGEVIADIKATILDGVYPNCYIGAWVDADGKLYIEPSQHFDDRQDAIEAGVERNQISIWDIENAETIDLQ